MIAIKPVSDLRNYNEVLQDVADESPVFLTKNGRGIFAVITIKDYERLTATKTLFTELNKREDSAVNNGWLDPADVREMVDL
ncbi:MAG: type II toxin-antitoxin system prevent-host-death family antitoxin [Treponemataceae bacterium]|nr:type II toxin-antitoxin system prevent-host-death family antitoxin [Treponemataceae bacterium]